MIRTVRVVLVTAVVATIVVISCKKNHPPETPTPPEGPKSGTVDESCIFASASDDPDGDSVAIQFDWGDSASSAWSNYVASGMSVTLAKAWRRDGRYQVRARAHDLLNVESDWSAAESIVIVSSAGPLSTPVVCCVVANEGGTLSLSWPQVSGATGYYVDLDGVRRQLGSNTFDVDSPAKTIQVSAYNGAGESDKWNLFTMVVTTSSVTAYGTGDSANTMNAIGFNTSGTCAAIDMASQANWPGIDFVLEDRAPEPMSFWSPDAYYPPFNSKDNATASSTVTDYDALTEAAPTGQQLYNTMFEIAQGGVYSLWIDPTCNGWSPDDHFGKVKVESIQGHTVVMTVGYQLIGGLRWLISR